MRAILIDPFERSIATIQTDLSLPAVRELIGEKGLDFCRPFPGHPFEVAIVGDSSALHEPPLARFTVTGYPHILFGKSLVYGVDKAGKDLSTSLTVDQIRDWIEFE